MATPCSDKLMLWQTVQTVGTADIIRSFRSFKVCRQTISPQTTTTMFPGQITVPPCIVYGKELFHTLDFGKFLNSLMSRTCSDVKIIVSFYSWILDGSPTASSIRWYHSPIWVFSTISFPALKYRIGLRTPKTARSAKLGLEPPGGKCTKTKPPHSYYWFKKINLSLLFPCFYEFYFLCK